MNHYQNFKIYYEKDNFVSFADPPEDPLGELTPFEMRLRNFCFECDRRFFIEVGDRKIQLFFDPDLCMILDDGLPEQIDKLSQGKQIEISIAESDRVIIKLIPIAQKILCTLRYFGSRCEEKTFDLDKTQVLTELKGFLHQVMAMAVSQGYITPEDKDEFLAPVVFNDAKTGMAV
ncbi:MAG: hypothetical protein ABIK73_09280 [candidate division WOR-3 bacterium]